MDEDDRERSNTEQRGLLRELLGFLAHCFAVLLILIVIALFARDWVTVFHMIRRQN